MGNKRSGQKEVNDVVVDCCIWIVDGYSRAQIIAKIRERNEKTTELAAGKYYYKALKYIEQKSANDAEEVINTHVAWYEQLYRKFHSLDFVPGKNAAMRQKEKILGLLKDDNVIKIENEVNITVGDGAEYDLNKLTEDEKKRLERYFKWLKVK